MKYVFLFFGLVMGIFWSQLYAEFGKVVNGTFFYQEQPVKQVAEAVAKKPVVRKAAEIKASEIKTPETKTTETVADASAPKKQVIMYATSWCGYCKKAREYFKSSGISYIEYDIEKDETAKRMHELLGGGGVPMIVYNGRKMTGFSAQKFAALYR